MAQVPILSGPSQVLQPLPSERFRAPDTGEAGRTLAAGIGNLGQSAQQAAEIQHQTDTMYAEARAKQGDNSYVEAERKLLYGDPDTGESGYYTQQGANALSARGGVEQAISKLQANLLSKTQDKLEHGMLESVLQRRSQQTLDGISRYAQGQALTYANEQSASRVSNSVDSYVRNVDNPELQKADVATIDSELASQAQRNGWNDPEIIKSHRETVYTAMHTAMLDSLMLNDPAKARDYLAAHRDEMDPSKAQAEEAKLTPLLVDQDAKKNADLLEHYGAPLASPVMQNDPSAPGATKKVPLDLTTVWQSMIGRESGGHQLNSQGGPLASNKGAIGMAQVLPATAQMMASELGVGWDENRYKTDPQYNAMLGKAYFGKLLRTFGGDVTKAVAAYNAGPGDAERGARGVRGAMRRASADGEPGNWVAHLPQETQAYVRGILGSHADGGPLIAPNTLSPDTQAGVDLATQMANVDQVVRERLDGQPPRYVEQVIDATKKEIRQRYEERHIEAQGREAAQKEDAYNQVFNLHDQFTDVGQINGWQNLSPEFRIQLQNVADANRKALLAGGKQKTDFGFYSNLSDAYASDPDAFLAVPVAAARSHLSDEDFKAYVGWRKDVIAGKQKNLTGTGRTTAAQVLSIAETSLAPVGLTTANLKGPKRQQIDAERGQFVNAMMREVDRFREANHREPNSEEIRKEADRLVMQGSWPGESGRTKGFVFEGMNKGFFTGQKGGSVEVPDAVRADITKQFPHATPQQVHDIYIRYKGRYW